MPGFWRLICAGWAAYAAVLAALFDPPDTEPLPSCPHRHPAPSGPITVTELARFLATDWAELPAFLSREWDASRQPHEPRRLP